MKGYALESSVSCMYRNPVVGRYQPWFVVFTKLKRLASRLDDRRRNIPNGGQWASGRKTLLS